MISSDQEELCRFNKILPHLVCPLCKGDLKYKPNMLCCFKCDKRYPVKNNKIYFIESKKGIDSLDRIKEILKKYLGNLYYTFGVNIISPTYPFLFEKEVYKLDPEKKIIIDLGSGNYRYNKHIISLDLNDYNEVDIVCNIEKLPFKNESIYAFVSRSVFEHLANPLEVEKEIFRCTTEDGKGCHLIPFMYPFHASPFDYNRYTAEGQKNLFSKWEIIKQFNPTGPFSLLVIILTEVLSIFLSFGKERLKSVLYLFLCLILFPIKFVDFFFAKNTKYLTLSPNIFIEIKKRKL